MTDNKKRYVLTLEAYVYAADEKELAELAHRMETNCNAITDVSDAEVFPFAILKPAGRLSFFPQQVKFTKKKVK